MQRSELLSQVVVVWFAQPISNGNTNATTSIFFSIEWFLLQDANKQIKLRFKMKKD
jgi:hypothetical protein